MGFVIDKSRMSTYMILRILDAILLLNSFTLILALCYNEYLLSACKWVFKPLSNSSVFDGFNSLYIFLQKVRDNRLSLPVPFFFSQDIPASLKSEMLFHFY